MSENTNAVRHPVVEHHLSFLRDENTSPIAFRNHLKQLSILLASFATRDLPVREVTTRTPMAEIRTHRITGRIGLAPILRAGLGMLDPILEMIPEAEVWHLGMYRDEETSRPVEYYSRLDSGSPVEVALILDPMLATGGSALAAIDRLKEWGVERIKLLSIIAAPEGIATIEDACPEVQIDVCSIDERLNDVNFIVPGLGDAGDRCFNTTLG